MPFRFEEKKLEPRGRPGTGTLQRAHQQLLWGPPFLHSGAGPGWAVRGLPLRGSGPGTLSLRGLGRLELNFTPGGLFCLPEQRGEPWRPSPAAEGTDSSLRGLCQPGQPSG